MSTYIIRTYLIYNTLDYSSSGSVLNRLKVFDIERTDSGVGSETSKSSKASVEIRRAPSLSKSSDSGSGKTLILKGVFSKPSGNLILGPDFCLLS